MDGGKIAAIRPPMDGEEVVRLSGKVLLPGFVNAHSHAFQRAIRGRSEYRQQGRASDDFWTWREEMYRAAMELGPEEIEAVSRMAFLEMALAGITTVGEFHYIHHPAGGGRYADPDELALRVHAAAREVGVEVVLLRVGYRRAGFGKEAHPRQIRFVDESPGETLDAVERLGSRGMRVGVAPHSVRALPLEWIREMASFAREAGLPLHMHVSEQPREVEECLQEHGLRPVELLDSEGILDERFTGVHGVHLSDGEVRALGRAEANICACPTTERNLGDGILPARKLFDEDVSISFGTDSQIEIAPLQDARCLEYHLRLQAWERAILGASDGDVSPSSLAEKLLRAATAGGARSLGTEGGVIEVGAPADLLAIDLEDPSICGASKATLVPNLVFSMERTAIRDVWVGGKRIVADGRHPLQEKVVQDFRSVMARRFGRG